MLEQLYVTSVLQCSVLKWLNREVWCFNCHNFSDFRFLCVLLVALLLRRSCQDFIHCCWSSYFVLRTEKWLKHCICWSVYFVSDDNESNDKFSILWWHESKRVALQCWSLKLNEVSIYCYSWRTRHLYVHLLCLSSEKESRSIIWLWNSNWHVKMHRRLF